MTGTHAAVNTPAPLVVVGVDKAPGSVLTYAVERAEELGGRLRVVHAYVVPPTKLVGTYTDDVELMFKAGGQALLDDARRFIESEGGAVAVDYVLRRGRAAPALLDESRDATELVLGQDDPTWASRFIDGQVSQRVVAASSCRVVVVPDQKKVRRS